MQTFLLFFFKGLFCLISSFLFRFDPLLYSFWPPLIQQPVFLLFILWISSSFRPILIEVWFSLLPKSTHTVALSPIGWHFPTISIAKVSRSCFKDPWFVFIEIGWNFFLLSNSVCHFPIFIWVMLESDFQISDCVLLYQVPMSWSRFVFCMPLSLLIAHSWRV